MVIPVSPTSDAHYPSAPNGCNPALEATVQGDELGRGQGQLLRHATLQPVGLPGSPEAYSLGPPVRSESTECNSRPYRLATVSLAELDAAEMLSMNPRHDPHLQPLLQTISARQATPQQFVDYSGEYQSNLLRSPPSGTSIQTHPPPYESPSERSLYYQIGAYDGAGGPIQREIAAFHYGAPDERPIRCRPGPPEGHSFDVSTSTSHQHPLGALHVTTPASYPQTELRYPHPRPPLPVPIAHHVSPPAMMHRSSFAWGNPAPQGFQQATSPAYPAIVSLAPGTTRRSPYALPQQSALFQQPGLSSVPVQNLSSAKQSSFLNYTPEDPIAYFSSLTGPARLAQWLQWYLEPHEQGAVRTNEIYDTYNSMSNEVPPLPTNYIREKRPYIQYFADLVVQAFRGSAHKSTVLDNGQMTDTIRGIRLRYIPAVQLPNVKKRAAPSPPPLAQNSTKRTAAAQRRVDQALTREAAAVLAAEQAHARTQAEAEATAQSAAYDAAHALASHQPIVTKYERYRWPATLYRAVWHVTGSHQQLPCTSAQEWVDNLMLFLHTDPPTFETNVYTTPGHVPGPSLAYFVVLHNATSPTEASSMSSSSTTAFGFAQFCADEISWRAVNPDMREALRIAVEKGWIEEIRSWDVGMRWHEGRRFHKGFWMASNRSDAKRLLNRARVDAERLAVNKEISQQEKELRIVLESDLGQGGYTEEDWEMEMQRCGDEVQGSDWDAYSAWDIILKELGDTVLDDGYTVPMTQPKQKGSSEAPSMGGFVGSWG